MEFATRTIHAAQPSEPGTGSLIAPIFQTSTYEQDEPGSHRGFDYSRTNDPTRRDWRRCWLISKASRTATFASRLAAENAILQAWLKPGDEIVIPQDVYGGTYRILNKVYQPTGCVIRQVDVGDRAALESAIDSRTRLVWIESPTNPRPLVYDIAEICRIAHASGALVVVDNTFATPLFQQPFQLGADIVVHSVTSYLAGHSDVIQGAVLAGDAAVFEPIKFLQNATGAVPAPFDCWLTLRGLKTLELRMQRHADNAGAIATALSAHPLVRRVYFPGLPDHPGHAIARRQMTGFGGMVSLNWMARSRRSCRSFRRGFFASARAWWRQVAGLSSCAHDSRVDPCRSPAPPSACPTRSCAALAGLRASQGPGRGSRRGPRRDRGGSQSRGCSRRDHGTFYAPSVAG